jgi:DNA (cytosine-5)-methyltransferase 1
MISVFDLFAGCGGLSQGLKDAGFDIRWANEISVHSCNTYRAAHTEVELYQEDANHLLLRLLDIDSNLPRPGEVDMICGGPPCQGFSGYNRFRNINDPRNSLVETFLGFVDHLQPRFVLMENVPGMLSLANGEIFRLILATLTELGYQTRFGILQAGYYGLPQNRWRIFIWASRNGEPLPFFPEPTHIFPQTTIFGATRFRDAIKKPAGGGPNLFSELLPTTSVWDAISDLPVIENGERQPALPYRTLATSHYQRLVRSDSPVIYNHVTTKLGELQLARCKAVPKRPGAGWLDLPEELKPKNLLRHGDKRYPNRFGRLSPTGIFNTIMTEPQPYWGSVFHPFQDRAVSVRECARAQGFKDEVHFLGPMSECYRQIGNAVPPPLAAAIGHELLAALNGKKD